MVCLMMCFKNVKLMFWADVVLCVEYLKNICPYNAIRNKTSYEMWYSHIPSIIHLRVFSSTCYTLIPKVRRDKVGARTHNCIFSKAYYLYNEVNKKFFVSIYVIFLESSKAIYFVEGELDRLDIFRHAK